MLTRAHYLSLSRTMSSRPSFKNPTLILFSHLRLVLPSVLFTLHFPFILWTLNKANIYTVGNKVACQKNKCTRDCLMAVVRSSNNLCAVN